MSKFIASILLCTLLFLSSCVSSKKYAVLSDMYDQSVDSLKIEQQKNEALTQKLARASKAQKMAEMETKEKEIIAKSLRKRVQVLESKVIVLKQSRKRVSPKQKQIKKRQRSSY